MKFQKKKLRKKRKKSQRKFMTPGANMEQFSPRFDAFRRDIKNIRRSSVKVCQHLYIQSPFTLELLLFNCYYSSFSDFVWRKNVSLWPKCPKNSICTTNFDRKSNLLRIVDDAYNCSENVYFLNRTILVVVIVVWNSNNSYFLLVSSTPLKSLN